MTSVSYEQPASTDSLAALHLRTTLIGYTLRHSVPNLGNAFCFSQSILISFNVLNTSNENYNLVFYANGS